MADEEMAVNASRKSKVMYVMERAVMIVLLITIIAVVVFLYVKVEHQEKRNSINFDHQSKLNRMQEINRDRANKKVKTTTPYLTYSLLYVVCNRSL